MACLAAVAGASAVTAAVTSASLSRSGVSSSASSSPLLLKRGVFGAALNGSKVPSRRVHLKLRTVRATSDDTTDPSAQLNDVVADLKVKWDAVENKSAVAVYGAGALVALWLSSTVVGAINSVPLLPKIMELIGLGYTGWFVYRYLLFKSSRKELVEDIEELKGKITGATSSVTGVDKSSTTEK
ncbi:hypothetical protein R1sor_018108 [Riccia sorocarpa]|uniref:Cyanobacterial aminoacyl-tRNA synthetase CAAD domain-containing protein n=1 Tax=Riccia sorocarpa TaxID=122646 RepID=A0ABD3I960_9MARC